MLHSGPLMPTKEKHNGFMLQVYGKENSPLLPEYRISNRSCKHLEQTFEGLLEAAVVLCSPSPVP